MIYEKEFNLNEIKYEKNEITKDSKPIKYAMQNNYPFNSLKDNVFELLIYDILNDKKNKKIKDVEYDKCSIVSGPGDKGRDVVLYRENKIVCVIQCKRHSNLLEKPELAKEILKFVLFSIQDNCSDLDTSDLTYYIMVSTGLNREATKLVKEFNAQIFKEKDLQKWIRDVIADYKTLLIDITDEQVIKQINTLLSNIKIDSFLPSNLTNLLNQNKTIICTYFEAQSVINKEAFEQIINGTDLNVENFVSEYRENVVNNYSRLNFFGLDVPQKPRELELSSLFVEPALRVRGTNFLNTVYFRNKYHLLEKHELALDFNDSSKAINTINSPGLGKTLILNSIYEQLQFMNLKKSIKNPEETYEKLTKKIKDNNKNNFGKLFNAEKNIVILGRAGAGKSSLVKYSICKLLEKNTEIFENKKIYNKIPLRVELHEYNKEKIKNKIGIIEYITMLLENEFQINFISKKALESMLLNYETLIFFDGLDEVLDTSERIQVRNDIENFTRNHPYVKSIVTSRYESYDEVFFRDDDYVVYEVNDFDDDQMNEYINKWYKIQEKNSQVREIEVKSCKKELEKIDDELKRNPLLLTLILILYRSDLELPTSKLDIYKGCTHTLIETRDVKEKKLNSNLSVGNKLAIFASLANWQIETLEKKNKAITYQNALNHITKYLIGKREFKDENEAFSAAESLLEFSKVRSIYVENNFTHKTFLEYFTAYHIYSSIHGKGKFFERDEIISKHLKESSWHVILELLICLIDKTQTDFDIIDGIIEVQLEKDELRAVNFFLQIIRYLENISPDMVRKLLIKSLDTCVINNERNLSIVRAINNHLLSLSKIKSFSDIIMKCIDEYYDKLKTPDEIKQYFIFILENSINTEKIDSELIKQRNIEMVNNDPYLYILINYSRIISEEECYKCFKEFRSKFNDEDILKFYASRFGHNLFLDTSKFNWAKHLLFSKHSFRSFTKSYIFLYENGINADKIRKMIGRDTGEISLPESLLVEYLTEVKSDRMKRVICKALEHYYKRKINSREITKGFNVKKNNRKFPVPS